MTTTKAVFADDALATATATELAQRFTLIAELAEHPGINRESINRQLNECRELHAQLGAHLATVAFA